jgi:hypothetical protein
MAEERDIKYVNKTFSDFRQQLIDYAKNYFPDTYNDFSPTSPGMMFMEMAAYVGDILAFYQDIQVQETLLQYAQEPGNLYSLAYMMGYRPKVTSAATVNIDVYQRVDSDGSNNPNWDQALTIPENTQLESTTGTPVRFFIDKKINFGFSSSYDPTEVTVWSSTGNTVNEFLVRKRVTAFSGEVKSKQVTVVTPERFRTILLEDSNIVDILSITDSDNNTWYEVPYLAQDTIFEESANTSTDKSQVPSLLTLRKVPRRFVTRHTTTGKLEIQFGAGTNSQDDNVITPDPTNVGIGVQARKISKIDIAYDPSNFMYTGTYGLAPANTTLTIQYIVGGGIAANVPANTITNVYSQSTPTSQGGDDSKAGTIVYTNPSAATGGKDGDTVEEIRQNALRSYNEQLRAVTKEDYAVRALSLPSQFGSIAKVHVIQDQITSTASTTDPIIDSNPLSLSMYILAYNNNRNIITASQNLKENLRQYLSQYKLITDAINIKDAFVVNIGIQYEVVLRPGTVARDVLLACTQELQRYFDIRKWNINQPINISSLYTVLDRVKGVQTVHKIEITNKVGGNYSQYAYDITGATRNNIVYPSYDPCIFEVKFPNTDIVGRVTTL